MQLSSFRTCCFRWSWNLQHALLIRLKIPPAEHCLAVNLPGWQRTSAEMMSRSAYAVGSSCMSKKKKLQPVAAINPPAVFVFGSNSCEMNGQRTPIAAKMGQHPKQMSEPLSSVPPPKRCRFPLLATTGQGRSGTEIKGIHKEQSAQM